MVAAAHSRSLQLVQEGLQLKRQAIVCDRVGRAPELAADYVRVAGELEEAAAKCPLAPGTAKTATQLAAAAEKLAGAAANSSQAVAKAITLYKGATERFQDAAAACPDTHPNKSALEQHASEIAVRVIYLESLGGAPATIPVEDHIGELWLQSPGCNLSPAEESVPSPTEEREPDSVVVEPAPVVEPEAQSNPSREKTDFLDRAVELAAQAKELEAKGQLSDALKTYTDCLHLFAYVHKRDPRMANPKVKEMVRERMETILSDAEALKAYKTLSEVSL